MQALVAEVFDGVFAEPAVAEDEISLASPNVARRVRRQRVDRGPASARVCRSGGHGAAIARGARFAPHAVDHRFRSHGSRALAAARAASGDRTFARRRCRTRYRARSALRAICAAGRRHRRTQYLHRIAQSVSAGVRQGDANARGEPLGHRLSGAAPDPARRTARSAFARARARLARRGPLRCGSSWPKPMAITSGR